MVEVFYFLARILLHAIQPLLVPICFVAAWAIVFTLFWSVWTAVRDGVSNARAMHQIPCANCRFFTDSSYLKCPIHPSTALSNEAINCLDYEAITYAVAANSDATRLLGQNR